MKVVFSNIRNGGAGDLTANDETLGCIEAVSSRNSRSETRFKQVQEKSDDFIEKSAQDVFESLVNASNCANVQSEKIANGYMTMTRRGVYL